MLLPVTVLGALPCLEMTIVTGKPDMLEIFLPVKHSSTTSPRFEEGRSIRITLAAGTQGIRLVLPAYVAGQYVRIDPVAADTTARVSALRIGMLPAQ